MPQRSLDAFAVGLDRFQRALDEELDVVRAGGSVFKAVRGEYGSGKTFFARWLQEQGIGFNAWRDWIGRTPGFASMPPRDAENILRHMIKTEILSNQDGILWLGEEGEATFGRRNFLELFSVFTSPPLFSVRHGQTELGSVHELSFLSRDANLPILLLGGRSWQVTHLEWNKRLAWVQPVEERGRSRWLGGGPRLSFALSQSIRRVLASAELSTEWSRRAQEEIAEARAEFDWVSEAGTTMIAADHENGITAWWTFGGLCANGQLAAGLQSISDWRVTHNNLAVKFQSPVDLTQLREKIAELQRMPREAWPMFELRNYLDDLKFSVCLPRDLLTRMMRTRLNDEEALRHLLPSPIKQVHQHSGER